MPDLVYNLVALPLSAGAIAWVTRRARVHGPGRIELVLVLLALQCLFALAAALGAAAIGRSFFCAARLYAWGVFLHAPLVLVAVAWRVRSEHRRLAREAGAAALAILSLAAWSFLVEPRWLEVTHYRLESAELARPLRIVVLSDIQTDQIGSYERRVLSTARELGPDLVLVTGDYLQLYGAPYPSMEELADLQVELRALFLESGLAPLLGVHAVGGDVDPHGWEQAFLGTDVRTYPRSTTVELPGLCLTALDVVDSCRIDLELPERAGFHVVFGHRPDYSLGDVRADLLVAGHTHGGQVRLPFIGPLVTMSSVPRSSAAGLTRLAGGRLLLVSRGIGLEHGQAPPLRFLCRPELAVIDVVPVPAQAGGGSPR